MTKQQLIESILANSDRARRDDKFLQLKVWKAQGLPVEGEFAVKFLDDSTSSPEAITRTRRKLQERGYYPAPESVQLKRHNRANSIRQHIVKAPEPMELFERNV